MNVYIVLSMILVVTCGHLVEQLQEATFTFSSLGLYTEVVLSESESYFRVAAHQLFSFLWTLENRLVDVAVVVQPWETADGPLSIETFKRERRVGLLQSL